MLEASQERHQARASERPSPPISKPRIIFWTSSSMVEAASDPLCIDEQSIEEIIDSIRPPKKIPKAPNGKSKEIEHIPSRRCVYDDNTLMKILRSPGSLVYFISQPLLALTILLRTSIALSGSLRAEYGIPIFQHLRE